MITLPYFPNRKRRTSIFLRLLVTFFVGSTFIPCHGYARCLEHYTCQVEQDKKVVTCTDSGIDSVPLCLNPKLFSLTLHSTMIRTLYATSIIFYQDLKYLNLGNNRISTIAEKAFKFQKVLEELYLDNNKIGHIDNQTLYGLSDLKILSLQGNLLETIPAKVFQHVQKVEQLDLSFNRIESISDRAFQGLNHLNILRLAGNRLSVVPNGALSLVPQLAELTIGENHFETINEEDFSSLATLSTLDLSGTSFTDGIPMMTFHAIPDLEHLLLDDCKLLEVPINALSILVRLKSLKLNRNLFTEIPSGSFSTLQRLRSLSISGCPNLERIQPGSLKDNLEIEKLDLSKNVNLAFLPEDFLYLTKLSELDLHGNHLEYIPQGIVRWDDIATWKLHDNPLVCNCSASWLMKMIESNHSSTITCASPPKVKGLFLSSLILSDLSCGLNAGTRDIVIALSICAVILAVCCLVVFFLYQNHTCVRRMLKRHKLGTRDTNPCDSEYPCIKPVPVTEL